MSQYGERRGTFWENNLFFGLAILIYFVLPVATFLIGIRLLDCTATSTFDWWCKTILGVLCLVFASLSAVNTVIRIHTWLYSEPPEPTTYEQWVQAGRLRPRYTKQLPDATGKLVTIYGEYSSPQEELAMGVDFLNGPR